MMNEYKSVDVYQYVKDGLESGKMIPIKAEKYTRIIARVGVVGEKVISWNVDEAGNPIEEVVEEVKLDSKTGNPGWVVTKTSENGDIIIDNNGHDNSWIISDTNFRKKYEIENEELGLFKPTGGIQTFVRISENITFPKWGSAMKIAVGGYLNITNLDDIYGVSKRDFDDTYRIIDGEHEKTLV